MPRKQENQAARAIIAKIKTDPSAFIPTEKELRQLIAEREEVDRRLKEKGLTVILESNG